MKTLPKLIAININDEQKIKSAWDDLNFFYLTPYIYISFLDTTNNKFKEQSKCNSSKKPPCIPHETVFTYYKISMVKKLLLTRTKLEFWRNFFFWRNFRTKFSNFSVRNSKGKPLKLHYSLHFAGWYSVNLFLIRKEQTLLLVAVTFT